ncbi:hypothetical protein AL509_28840 [Achromobacter xylosoxidans]|nr:hypothetical protein AL509_28840 [Achromobacter xylosoxidans]
MDDGSTASVGSSPGDDPPPWPSQETLEQTLAGARSEKTGRSRPMNPQVSTCPSESGKGCRR